MNSVLKILEMLPRNIKMDDIEAWYLILVLTRNNGRRLATAKETGIKIRTLRNKINELKQAGYPIPELAKNGRPKIIN